MTTNPTHSPEVICTAFGTRSADLERRENERQAQLSFDFDAAWAALPPPSCSAPSVTSRGAAGQRLRGNLRTTWPEPLLVEFARETLGAQRISSGYLDALRVVLGNQAHAERGGYTLEQNLRVDFATERVMRTINAQMHAAGITTAVRVAVGSGRVQTVQCFTPERKPRVQSLNAVMRKEENHAERMSKHGPPKAIIPACISEADVLF